MDRRDRLGVVAPRRRTRTCPCSRGPARMPRGHRGRACAAPASASRLPRLRSFSRGDGPIWPVAEWPGLTVAFGVRCVARSERALWRLCRTRRTADTDRHSARQYVGAPRPRFVPTRPGPSPLEVDTATPRAPAGLPTSPPLRPQVDHSGSPDSGFPGPSSRGCGRRGRGGALALDRLEDRPAAEALAAAGDVAMAQRRGVDPSTRPSGMPPASRQPPPRRGRSSSPTGSPVRPRRGRRT